jgi:hypothetical protein
VIPTEIRTRLDFIPLKTQDHLRNKVLSGLYQHLPTFNYDEYLKKGYHLYPKTNKLLYVKVKRESPSPLLSKAFSKGCIPLRKPFFNRSVPIVSIRFFGLKA